MSTPLQPVVALLVSAAVLLMGNGLLSVLLPVRAGLDAFSQLDIGIMGSAYFLGLVIGCLVSPGIIARVGHIRAFAAFAAVATVTPLCHAIFPLPPVWWLLRALTGLCFAGLFMGIESWLNAASDRENRGRVLAAYTMLNLTVTTVGMQLSGLFPARGFELFSLVAVLYSLAAVPVSLTRTVAPTPPRRSRLRLVWLIGVSPAAVLACLFTGMVNGAFWTLGPTYAHAAGLGFEEVALFLSAAVLGGALAQWPVGLSSDRLGRRPVAALVSAAAALAGLGLV
ncbi:MAG: MFS transporter, partial [Hyphomicrobiaceae bacterium]|nr:MFS transporter [Hyphomicrobiaceae bacterium]